jgi:hypothetical protein
LDYGWTTGDRFPAEATNSPFLYSFQTGSGVHPASYIMVTGVSFLGGGGQMWPEAVHSPPSSSEVKEDGVVSSQIPTYFHAIVLNYIIKYIIFLLS